MKKIKSFFMKILFLLYKRIRKYTHVVCGMGLFGTHDWGAQNNGILAVEPKMCPNSAQKNGIFCRKCSKSLCERIFGAMGPYVP